jgi:formylglycine-generating enzyme required for sulfatase activity
MKTKTLFSRLTLSIMLLFVFGISRANNVQITGTSVTGSDITFTISWENSWRANVAPANWDAVWVFIKYQDCNTRLWAHAGLSTAGADHTTSSPLQVDPVADGRGVFIRRSALGGGTIAPTEVTLKMTIPAGTYNYKVFGIEMVNVPQANFEVGDATSAATFNSITVNSTSQASGISAASIGGGSSTIPNTYPTGYNSFYCMKNEISQLQYVEYLNSLTYDQQKAHTLSDPISAAGTYVMFGYFGYRNGIIISTPGNNAAIPAVYACDASTGVENNSDDGQSIVANNLSWGDLAAYLDWAALRPMTELEFEKVCRGSMSRVAGEYPWGTTDLSQVYSSLGGLINDYMSNETFTPVANGTCTYGVGSASSAYGPVRVGAFASGSSGRASAGAAFYGAMEMAGNTWERVVNTTAAGVSFNGTLGDGTIAPNGDANQATWPSITTAAGLGFRGGSYIDVAGRLRTSDRSIVTTADATRYPSFGGRGVR